MRREKKLNSTTFLLLALGLGIVFGFVCKALPAGILRDVILLNGLLRFLGNGFVSLIKMMVVPLVFVSFCIWDKGDTYRAKTWHRRDPNGRGSEKTTV